MERSILQFRLTSLLLLVACVAGNLWLFRLGFVWGIIGLNVSKHVAVAFLCQQVGVNRNPAASPGRQGRGQPHFRFKVVREP